MPLLIVCEEKSPEKKKGVDRERNVTKNPYRVLPPPIHTHLPFLSFLAVRSMIKDVDDFWWYMGITDGPPPYCLYRTQT